MAQKNPGRNVVAHKNFSSLRLLSSNTRNQNTRENVFKILWDNDFQLGRQRCPAKLSADHEGGGKIFFFFWRIIALQNLAVFCQTSTWISHRYTRRYTKCYLALETWLASELIWWGRGVALIIPVRLTYGSGGIALMEPSETPHQPFT